MQPSIKSCKELTNLILQNFITPSGAGWLKACSALSALPSLSILSLEYLDLEEVASDDWAFGSSLTSLTIEAGYRGAVPEALLSLTTLRHLSLYHSDLEELSEFPTGTNLEHIASLDLSETKLPALPAALLRISKLEEVKVFDDEPWLDVERLKSILPYGCV